VIVPVLLVMITPPLGAKIAPPLLPADTNPKIVPELETVSVPFPILIALLVLTVVPVIVPLLVSERVEGAVPFQKIACAPPPEMVPPVLLIWLAPLFI